MEVLALVLEFELLRVRRIRKEHDGGADRMLQLRANGSPRGIIQLPRLAVLPEVVVERMGADGIDKALKRK
ncbi:hypothetical protein ASNO1_66270 [Corallococcus caeni]|uniref:Uncharacterized protein n=1 Tax=Corallococcus caeni TaxID=3082388 RepID=A0ABQ6R245_9BACT|nr:hypothetical protein ASNO1_66270 [Corallococcus sp. NO1]